MTRALKIGTRGSPLALAQAAIVRDLLVRSGRIAEQAIETVIIRTSGDRIQDRSLAEIGGKGLFTKEIEEALTDGRIDLAVHSLKDLPAWMPEGLGLVAVLPRADPRDALLSPVADSIAALPPGARVGTSSPRRRALLLNQRPDLAVIEFRGNVGTRLAKLAAGEVDATLLAVAGMKRLGLEAAHHPLDPAEMLPAACQGAIGLESRLDDGDTRALCDAIGDPDTAIATMVERAFLATLDGSCRTPIAALARIDGDAVMLDGLVARTDGVAVIRLSGRARLVDAAQLGEALAQRIKAAMPPDFFAAAALGADGRQMAAQVVITRPGDEAGRLARQLACLGYETVSAPMMDIVPLDTPLPPLDGYAALVFTSANGARIFAARASQRRDVPAYAVGSQTARTLRDAGFDTVHTAGGDAEALAALIRRSGAKAVLHFSGRAIARNLGEMLAPAGILVDRHVLYDARPVAALPPGLATALYARTAAHVLFFSARTAAIFGTLVGDSGLTEMTGSISAYCFSREVATAAASLPWRHVAVAERPTTASLLALLPITDRTGSHGG